MWFKVLLCGWWDFPQFLHLLLELVIEISCLNKTSNLRITSCPFIKCSSNYRDLWRAGRIVILSR